MTTHTSFTSQEKYLNSAGTFTCEVEMPVNGWLAEIGEKNTPCVLVPLIVSEGPMAGRRITYFAWLSPNAIQRSMRTLYDCFQFNGDFETLAVDPNGFAGFRCRVVTEMETYRGSPRCSVKWLNAIDGGFMPTLDQKRAASLITQIGPQSKAIVRDYLQQKQEGRAGMKPMTQAGQTVTEGGGREYEDDIPF